MRGMHVVVGVVALGVMGMGPAAMGQSEVNDDGDTLFVVKSDESPSNAEIAARLSRETFTTEEDGSSRVVIARDDDFADALASGMLQRSAPLLLVPSRGPLPPGVLGELDRLTPSEAVVLGGEAAVSSGVEDELRGRGLTTRRYAGASRLETAVAVAEGESAGPDTVILARAFGTQGAEPTQAYADAIAAGGLAAETGWPVLLTQTDQLSGPTRAFLQSRADTLTNVVVLGGTAAVSEAAFDEAVGLVGDGERVAGAGRAATAVAVAEKRGAASASDVARVILVDGNEVDGFGQDGLAGPNAWAAGFAAAAHSGRFAAPILLTAGQTLPPETVSSLSAGIGGGGGVVLVCVTSATACEAARSAAGLNDAPPPPPPAGGSTLVGQLEQTTGDTAHVQAITGLWRIDVETGTSGRVLACSCSTETAGVYTPDGRQVVYADEDETGAPTPPRLLEVDTGTTTSVTDVAPAFTSDLAMAPGGSAVAFQSDDRRSMVIAPLDGSPERLLSIGEEAQRIAWATVGGESTILFTTFTELRRLDPATGAVATLFTVDDFTTDLRASVSPDGRTIALATNGDSTSTEPTGVIWFLDGDGTLQAQSDPVSLRSREVVWEPDSSGVVFEGPPPGSGSFGFSAIWEVARTGAAVVHPDEGASALLGGDVYRVTPDRIVRQGRDLQTSAPGVAIQDRTDMALIAFHSFQGTDGGTAFGWGALP